uniref:Uncharacterized protein n=1 Tax=Erythrolobus australicus TaxID=1077150 RepID=A0A7S1TJD2_9RHOD
MEIEARRNIGPRSSSAIFRNAFEEGFLVKNEKVLNDLNHASSRDQKGEVDHSKLITTLGSLAFMDADSEDAISDSDMQYTTALSVNVPWGSPLSPRCGPVTLGSPSARKQQNLWDAAHHTFNFAAPAIQAGCESGEIGEKKQEVATQTALANHSEPSSGASMTEKTDQSSASFKHAKTYPRSPEARRLIEDFTPSRTQTKSKYRTSFTQAKPNLNAFSGRGVSSPISLSSSSRSQTCFASSTAQDPTAKNAAETAERVSWLKKKLVRSFMRKAAAP